MRLPVGIQRALQVPAGHPTHRDRDRRRERPGCPRSGQQPSQAQVMARPVSLPRKRASRCANNDKTGSQVVRDDGASTNECPLTYL